MKKSLFFLSLSLVTMIALVPRPSWAGERSEGEVSALKSASCPDAGTTQEAFLKWLECEERLVGLRNPSEPSPTLLPAGTPGRMDKTYIDTVLPKEQPVNRQLAGQAWLDLDLLGRCQFHPPLLNPSCT